MSVDPVEVVIDPMDHLENNTFITDKGYERLPVTVICVNEKCKFKHFPCDIDLDISHGPADSLGVVCGGCGLEPSIQIL